MSYISDLLKHVNVLIFVVGVILVLIGITTPRRFFSIEVDWSVAQSASVSIIGLIFLGWSAFEWWSNPAHVTTKDMSPTLEEYCRAKN